MNLPKVAIHRPVTVLMLAAVVVLLGLVSFSRLPVDLMPDVEFPSLTVRTQYSGVGPEEIETLITRPIERSMASVPMIERITATSSEGSSNVTIAF